VNTSHQVVLSVVLAMLFVFVIGNYMISGYQLLASSHSEHASDEPSVKIKKASPHIVPNQKYDQIVEEVANTYGLDSALLNAIITVESGFNPNAISKNGASGLMQLTPSIAKHYGVVDLLDPVQNLHGGAKYLRDMLILFNNDVSLAVAAYNAGETAVVRYGNRIPPYGETMIFVPRVLNIYRKNRENRLRQFEAVLIKGKEVAMLCNGVELPISEVIHLPTRNRFY
jgi:soluble lytic murein transglycosylase-like protein